MTAEQLKDKKFVVRYLSERWGTVERFKIQRHKAVGNWLFVKCQEKYFYDEDDYIGKNPTYVYSIPLHNETVSAEIYDEHDPDTFDWAKVKGIADKLDNREPHETGNRQPNKLPEFPAIDDLCLYGIDGDCEEETLPIKLNHRSIVSSYLKAQLAWELSSSFEDLGTKKNRSRLEKMWAEGEKLEEAGIFLHKYHYRTTWRLMLTGDVEIKREGKEKA